MSRRQLRGSRRISKSKNRRLEHAKILIVAEGRTTEPQYFEKFSALIRAKAVRVVSVKSVGIGRDPLRVVSEAKRIREVEKKGGDPFDSTWCVVDVDEHTNLEQECSRPDAHASRWPSARHALRFGYSGILRTELHGLTPKFFPEFYASTGSPERTCRTNSRTINTKWP
ncbi:RloB family protein [Streptomyces sp. WMMC1477]|nr:RloB family protein [Streptomyces sp. WMMC1477]MCZ7433119.1 RloB family protein [Streptomyces sp. WMMC1477]